MGKRTIEAGPLRADGKSGWRMQTLVERAVAETLRNSGGEVIRLYVAACAERMVPLFTGLRAGAPGREADLDFCVRSVGDLWHTGQPLADAERVGVLERFPELQPSDEGITDVADTYAFFGALVLRHALSANDTGDARDAVACGHVALTAMGMLDQNLTGAGFGAEEQRLQSCSASGDAAGLWEASVTAGRERFRAVLGRTGRGGGWAL
ncbi:hypothetical protein [uncultured Streptomyces sp.]|uniref:hypothetical protein n=1 Tax=uncultured Streptomyces sp. TaxID=174707 RepID=UPI00261C4C83|nr:hypothetical protein [uncultured Streptomyces sp.]